MAMDNLAVRVCEQRWCRAPSSLYMFEHFLDLKEEEKKKFMDDDHSGELMRGSATRSTISGRQVSLNKDYPIATVDCEWRMSSINIECIFLVNRTQLGSTQIFTSASIFEILFAAMSMRMAGW
jgi:hypothetical protein